MTNNADLPKLIPAGPARTEIRASNSRFIASAAPSATVAAARAFIAVVRAEMPDASHHVYAYIIGHGATTTLSMTDGKCIGKIHLPEPCANLCFGGVNKNRLFMAASQSLYSLYIESFGAQTP